MTSNHLSLICFVLLGVVALTLGSGVWSTRVLHGQELLITGAGCNENCEGGTCVRCEHDDYGECDDDGEDVCHEDNGQGYGCGDHTDNGYYCPDSNCRED